MSSYDRPITVIDYRDQNQMIVITHPYFEHKWASFARNVDFWLAERAREEAGNNNNKVRDDGSAESVH